MTGRRLKKAVSTGKQTDKTLKLTKVLRKCTGLAQVQTKQNPNMEK